MIHDTTKSAHQGGPLDRTDQRLLTADEVAQILNVSKSFAYQLMQQGDGIPVVRLGRAVRCRPQDLDAYIESQVCCASTSKNGGCA
jgi:excisionase family DNA binding protein